jgi:hypothetical protein
LVLRIDQKGYVMKFDRPNDPNPGRLVDSLRYLGYGNYEAIADLVDNSIDADANVISVRIQQRETQIQILIADNGAGMDIGTLDEAMKLGSLTVRDMNSDLGKFGMGLVTASLSIARRCHVITRAGKDCFSSAWDVDDIVANNAFRKHLAPATQAELELLNEHIGAGSTGTLVILSKCDNITNRNTTTFGKILSRHLGRVHRYFIDAGRKLIVNEEAIPSIDPLQLSDPATEVILDDVFSVSIEDDGNKRTENVRARIVLVPESTSSDLDIGRSLKAQGFYLMRNQREIMDAVTLEFFTKHNDFNRMRGELFFPGTLDKWVGIEFTKRQVNLEQSIHDQLATTLVSACRAIKRREVNRKRADISGPQQEMHSRSAKAIAEKDKLLLKPKAKIEKRASPQQPSTPRNTAEQTTKERKNYSRTQAVDSRLNCEIREERLGPNGQIYECDLEGRKIILRYNVEHPFYQKFVLDNLDDPRLISTVDFLIYSMASAELRMIDDSAYDAANSFKAVMSSNLRTLLN